MANGEYILFVDGDDYIRKDTVEILYNKAKGNNYDMVRCKFFVGNSNGSISKGDEKQIDESQDILLVDLLF